MRRRLIGVVVGLMLLLVLGCSFGAAATRTSSPGSLLSFRIHLGSVQLTVGPTRFARCEPSWIGARCEALPDADQRMYYAVSLHQKMKTAGLWRERTRWIIALPF